MVETGKNAGTGMIVEFVGPPGSGKSTIARHAADRLAGEGFYARAYNLGGRAGLDGVKLNRRQRRTTQAAALIRQPRLTAVTISALRSSKVSAVEMVGACRRSDALRQLRGRHETSLLTEGPLGAICLASYLADDPELIPRAMAASHLADAVVVLSVSDETATRRIQARGHAFATKSVEAQQALVEGIRAAHTTMRSYLSVPVGEYSNEGEVDEVVGQVAYDLANAMPGDPA